jgi:hypothetical protein
MFKYIIDLETMIEMMVNKFQYSFLEYRFNKKLQKAIKIHPVFKVPVFQKGNMIHSFIIDNKYEFFGKRSEFSKCNQ